jgi:phosphate transport system substrate-binding protein
MQMQRRSRLVTLSLLAPALAASLTLMPGCGESGGSSDGSGSGGSNGSASRGRIDIVGSSTVYPFSSYVAEEFGKTTQHQTPKVEKTGSGAGHKLWGDGDGLSTPDITNSSRRMNVSEFKRAKENGVESITEAVIGYDGIAVAQNVSNDPINLTLKQITLAVAAEVPQDGELVKNPYTNWSEIDSSLPDRKITIYGPPTTSGTRDAFEELVLEHATENMDGYDGAYTEIRQDGAWVTLGENDNVFVQRLTNNEKAFGIFGYSFLAENTNKIEGASINGVAPKPEAISSGEYPISRSLFFYIKNSHRGEVPGLEQFLDLFMSKRMIGPNGYCREQGLIALPEKMLEASRQRVLEGSELRLKDDGTLTTLEDYMNGEE